MNKQNAAKMITDNDRRTYVECLYDTCTVCSSHQRAKCAEVRDERCRQMTGPFVRRIKMSSIKIPTWEETDSKTPTYNLNNLERFIYEHEDPCDGKHGALWRERFIAALEFAIAEAARNICSLKLEILKNIIYQAVSKITEEREANGKYIGNGHHLAQEITEAVEKAISAHNTTENGSEQVTR